MTLAEDEVGPVPPPELAGYILGSDASDDVVHMYRQQGAELRAVVLGQLGNLWPKPGARALDFGCGSGRVLRQFSRDVSRGELVGCDIDAECVAWVAAQLPTVEAFVNTELPPLPYGDATFDVVWATSVFSHLTDSWAAWLLELRRVLRPGGRALVSVMGEASSERIVSEPWDPDRIGMTVRGFGRPWSAGGPMVLHSEWWVRAHWSRALTIRAFETGAVLGQDMVVLEHPGGRAPSTDALKTPEPGDSRELAAALHAIELANREHLELNRQHDAYAKAYADETQRTAALLDECEALRHELARLRTPQPTRGGRLHGVIRRALSR